MSVTIPIVTASGARSTVTLPNPVVTQPPPPTTRLFTGDYAGGFGAWSVVQNKVYNGPAASYNGLFYGTTLVNDPTYGKAARFEVRKGDVPSFGGGERSEVQSETSTTGGTEGLTRWYALRVKFDPTFPQNHPSIGWGVVKQWHADAAGSPPIGWYVDRKAGHFSLVLHKQSSPGTIITSYSILDIPLSVGNWHDLKMQIRWSKTDTVGFVKCWLGGVPQVFIGPGAGQTQHFVRTMVPGTTATYYKEGYYREAGIAATGTVFHANFRTAQDEASL